MPLSRLLRLFGRAMANRVAIFIDGAYLDFVLKDEFHDARIDYEALSKHLAGDGDILRTYYYHCPVYQGNPPTKTERERYATQRKFFAALENIPRYTVRLGRLGPVNTISRIMIQFWHGNNRSPVSTHRAPSPGAAGQCQPFEPASAQRNLVRRRAWLQMAGVAGPVWQLAYHLHPHEPLVQERRTGPDIRTPAEGTDSARQAGGGFYGQHYRQGPSRRHGCVKKNGPQSIGKSRGGWTTKIHMVAADARTAITFSLSPGQAHDAPEGRKLLHHLGPQHGSPSLLMDRAYEGNETRQLALALGFTPVVPPLKSRIDPWEYDREIYKKRNETERLFRRLKGFRRIFSRFDKLDVLFLGFILFGFIIDAIR